LTVEMHVKEISRRRVLRRAAIAGAAAWSAPLIQTLGGTSAWAAGSPAPGGGSTVPPVSQKHVKFLVVIWATGAPVAGATITIGSWARGLTGTAGSFEVDLPKIPLEVTYVAGSDPEPYTFDLDEEVVDVTILVGPGPSAGMAVGRSTPDTLLVHVAG